MGVLAWRRAGEEQPMVLYVNDGDSLELYCENDQAAVLG